MGNILGGGKSKDSSKAINTSAQGVATAAQAGGQSMNSAITGASQTSANSILQGSQTAANSAMQGAQTVSDAQKAAQVYLQQSDYLPSGLRDNALYSLGHNYGAFGGGGSITDRAMASPLYKAAVQQGENAVLRNASATGGLRSGSASENLAQVNQNALIAAYNDQIAGLQGLSSLPSNANTIAGYIAGSGNALGQGQANYGNTLGQGQVTAAQTLSQGQISAAEAIANANNAAATAVSQGQVAAAQSKVQGSQNQTNNMMGLAGLGMSAMSMFSDPRLKTDVVFVGEENGIRKYRWTWNKLAARLGLRGKSGGVMANEIARSHPQAVSMRDGFMVVDYQQLGVTHGILFRDSIKSERCPDQFREWTQLREHA